MRVRIIDDQCLQRSILSAEVLHALGDAEVVSASGGIEQLGLIGRIVPDDPVTGIDMPGLDGCLVIRYLQTCSRLRPPAHPDRRVRLRPAMDKLPATAPILFRPCESVPL